MIPSGNSVYIRGLDELERNADKLIKAMTTHKTEILQAAANKVKSKLRANTPKGPTGNMRAATYAKVLPETTMYPAVAYIGFRPKKAPHAHLVEHGHGGPHPAPAYPVVKKTKDEIKAEVMSDMEKGITKVVENAF